MATPMTSFRKLDREDTRSEFSQVDVSELNNEYKVPPPKYRHAAPSAPWPWMEFDQDEAEVRPLTPVDNVLWTRYPTSHFGNWTAKQVDRCRMLTICRDNYQCQIHKVEVCRNGGFRKIEEAERTRRIISEPAVAREYWDELHKPLDPELRVQALFVESITLNVLQILGARYNIEPFFFASSANWIPSRYQEDPHHGEGDHITVVLPFVRAVSNERLRATPLPSDEIQPQPLPGKAPITDKNQTIDTQAPLVLSERKILLQDLLAIHMVRNTETNVIISYHHNSQFQKTTAKRLQSLVHRTSDSVYWSKIYHKTKDPTFVFLSILWYPLYAWDEALEELYAHLTKRLETTRAENATEHTALTRELHKLQAHLLYYQQLLRDFSKSVEFVWKTHNPAMDADSITDAERKVSKDVMDLEANNLLSEIERLEKQRKIQSDRLDNAIRLAFATVNIEDSHSMQKLTMATLKDSAAMKQISYLTIVFLPASFLASVFGMNVAEINPNTNETLPNYIVSTVILTAITAWFVIALQEHSSFHRGGSHYLERVLWPAFYGYRSMRKMMMQAKGQYGQWRQQRRV